MSDPVVAAIPVRESAEGLVDVRADGRLLVDLRKQDPDGHFAQVREGVAGRLLAAQGSLPDGLRILFVEGYRPPALQRAYFEEYLAELRLGNPAASEQELFSAASRYVSPPDIAPHSAGAAVDLTLTTDDGAELDMGTRVNANPEESDGACFTGAHSISAQARANRDVLGRALAAAGLVNYPTEWWHWSYGDRYWALATGASAACYGPVSRPGSGGLAGHVVGGRQHLPADGLQLNPGQDQPGRHPIGHAPFPDRGGVQAATCGQPPRPLVRVAVKELERVFAHEDAEVVFGLGNEAVRVDEFEAVPGGLQCVPLVDVAVHEDGALIVVGGDPAL
jgi:D-alanyl-D-alanine dipeptidase